MEFKTLEDYVGHTPLVRLKRIGAGRNNVILAKLEGNNPAGSVKDRPALSMILRAEARGSIQPGQTLIEATSGNTGIALAMAAAIRGYGMILVMPENQSIERRQTMRAFGAELVLTPKSGGMEHARDLAEAMQKRGEGKVLDQFGNADNPRIHYETTGPELWEQTGGEITHFVSAMGTTGTITGVAKYLKEKNPDIQVWGADTYGSVFKKYHETGVFDPKEIYPYITEGIGEDFLPENVDFSVIDHFEKVTDRDAAMLTREIVRAEGIWVGNSAGSAIAGLLQLKDNFKEGENVVVIFHDHGTRYLGKMFNPDWMRSMGYVNEDGGTARAVAAGSGLSPRRYDEETRALFRELRRRTGVLVPVDAFDLDKLPTHLRMTFVVENADGTEVARSKDLDALQRRAGVVRGTVEIARQGAVGRAQALDGERAAVHRHEGAATARSLVVQRAGDELFTGARLSEDGDGGRRGSDALDDLGERAHGAGEIFLFERGRSIERRLVERGDERVFAHQLGTRGVDDEQFGLRELQTFSIDEVAGAFAQVRVQA